MSTQTYASSALSDEPASIFDSGASMKSFSDTASIFSTTSSKAAARSSTCLQTQSDASDIQTGQRGSQENSPSSALMTPNSAQSTESASTPTATTATPRHKASFMCSFCKEVGIPKTCTRKNDLKRHIEDFHHTDAQWVCRYRGCQLVFDWQTAYKAHLKAEHGGSRMSPDEAKVNLCPQVVFACGFEHCLQVFEACDEADAAHVFKEYVTHIVKHFDDGTQSGDWTYSRRMRNLLSQAHVHGAWASSGLDSVGRARLDWDPQTSCVLRKRLECRHVKDPALLVHYAISLGSSDLAAPPSLPPDFVTPVRDTCAEPGHASLKRPLAPQDSPSDQFNFRISRGANPALAQYFNAQRRIYVPNRGSNGSRRHTQQNGSSRGSMSAATSPAANPASGLGHYSLLNSRANSANYEAGLADPLPPPAMYGGGSQPFNLDNMLNHQQQDFMRGGGGEDVQVRSSSPEDIGMADAAAAPQANMSLPYSGILHQSRTPDMSSHGMEQNGAFYQDEARQNAAVMSGDYMERSL